MATAELAAQEERQDVEDEHQRGDGSLGGYFEDDGPEEDEFEQILFQIKNDVDCLMRLAITIRNPAPHEQFRSRRPELVSSFDTVYLEHVQQKFPQLQSDAAKKLSKALTYRNLFFRYREDHHERLNEGLEDEKQDTKSQSRAGATTEATWLPEDERQGGETGPRAAWRDDVSETTATSYAPTCADGSELRVPRIPPGYVDGPFLCPYCYIPITIENRYQWK